MITILSGGKSSPDWARIICQEYEKRLRKPFDVKWEILNEEKLNKKLENWPFSPQEYIIVLDERGIILDSPAVARQLNHIFTEGKNIIIIIGGAYGLPEIARQKANLVWSFSKLVFPHLLMRVMLTEQIYRAQEISTGGKYHHE